VLENQVVPDDRGADKTYTKEMNKSGSYSLLIICFMLLLTAHSVVLSQDASVKAVTETDTTAKTPDNSKHSVYLGSTISQDQPYGYGSLIYGFNSKLYASVSAVHLSGLSPFVSFYIGSLSYSHVFNSWFDISTGLYRYQVSPSLTDTLFSNFTYGDLTLGFDWRLIYSKISVGGLLSEENQAYFQLRNSRFFKTPAFFNDKAYISFDPYVNLLFGTLITTETSTETSVTLSSPYRKWRTYNQTSTTSTTYTRKFGLMEIDFGLPVSFNTDFITIEAEAAYVLPMYDDPDYPGSKGFIFLLSGIFRIF
jgi:hypothetical protein